MRQIELLKKYELKVRGVRGQHLMIDENIQRKFVSEVNPKPGETILEIGPGLGAITELMLQTGAKVIAIEHDPRFVEVLKGELAGDYANLEIVKADILKINLEKYVPKDGRLKVAGNIPYYITSPIILFLIAFRKHIDTAHLTVQKEIADRIFAQPGSKAYGRLSLLVRFYSDARRAFEISKNSFSPRPKVDSSVIELTFRDKLPFDIDEKVLFGLIKYGFGKRRKNILNALTEGFAAGEGPELSKEKIKELLKQADIKETIRAEALMLKDFIRLAEVFSKDAASDQLR